MDHSTVTDEELALRLQQGDTAAMTLIYERYKQGLFSFCRRLLSDRDAAEDALQETVIKMIAARATLSNPSSLRSWLYTIARNEALSIIRRRNHIRELTDDDENIFVTEDEPKRLETAERTVLVESALNRLLPQYKEVLLLREYETMNYEEIASVTGATVSSVKSRLFKARRALLEQLKPYRKAGHL
jgi:RNA polymerase sigma-70 factor (ECF subfamily)